MFKQITLSCCELLTVCLLVFSHRSRMYLIMYTLEGRDSVYMFLTSTKEPNLVLECSRKAVHIYPLTSYGIYIMESVVFNHHPVVYIFKLSLVFWITLH